MASEGQASGPPREATGDTDSKAEYSTTNPSPDLVSRWLVLTGFHDVENRRKFLEKADEAQLAEKLSIDARTKHRACLAKVKTAEKEIETLRKMEEESKNIAMAQNDTQLKAQADVLESVRALIISRPVPPPSVATPRPLGTSGTAVAMPSRQSSTNGAVKRPHNGDDAFSTPFKFPKLAEKASHSTSVTEGLSQGQGLSKDRQAGVSRDKSLPEAPKRQALPDKVPIPGTMPARDKRLDQPMMPTQVAMPAQRPGATALPLSEITPSTLSAWALTFSGSRLIQVNDWQPQQVMGGKAGYTIKYHTGSTEWKERRFVLVDIKGYEEFRGSWENFRWFKSHFLMRKLVDAYASSRQVILIFYQSAVRILRGYAILNSPAFVPSQAMCGLMHHRKLMAPFYVDWKSTRCIPYQNLPTAQSKLHDGYDFFSSNEADECPLAFGQAVLNLMNA